jgi:hypothetical protein
MSSRTDGGEQGPGEVLRGEIPGCAALKSKPFLGIFPSVAEIHPIPRFWVRTCPSTP